MALGVATCISQDFSATTTLEDTQIDSNSSHAAIPIVRAAKTRNKTQKCVSIASASSKVIEINPTSPSDNLKQTLLNFTPSPKPIKVVATPDLEDADKTDGIITLPPKCISDQDNNKSFNVVSTTAVTVKVEDNADTISSLQVVQQSMSVMSPKSLKQTVLTVQSEEKLFKKPPSRRREINRKRSQQPTRHHSVDLSASSERVPSQSRAKAVSVSPKKNTRLDSKEPGKENTEKVKYQTFLTSYGIRKTARQYAKEIEREREVNYLAALRNNVENGMKIIQTEEKGRGIIATRPFYDGEFVVEYAGDLISEKLAKQREIEYKKDPNIGSYMFFFSYGGQRYCVDATQETKRLGRLINHSRLHPNCVVKVIPIDGVPRLSLFARRPIAPGEELLYDYGDRDKETLVSHPWLKT